MTREQLNLNLIEAQTVAATTLYLIENFNGDFRQTRQLDVYAETIKDFLVFAPGHLAANDFPGAAECIERIFALSREAREIIFPQPIAA